MPVIKKTKPIHKPERTLLPVSTPDTMETSYTDVTQLNKETRTTPKKPYTIDTYYAQNLGRDDQPRPLDIEASPTLQNYSRIKGIVVDVTSPISSSRDADSDYTDVTIGFDMPPNMSATAGDMFIAHVDATIYAVFLVTVATEASYSSRALTQVEAKVIGLSTRDNTLKIINNLNLKTTVELTYDIDAAALGSDGLVDSAVSENLDALKQDYESLMRGYVREFKDIDSDNLYLPTSKVVFDPNVARYVSRVFTQHNYFKDYARNVRTLYDRMLDRDDPYLNPVHTYMQVMPVANTWIRNHLNYTDAELVVVPNPETKLHPTDVDKPLYADDVAAALGADADSTEIDNTTLNLDTTALNLKAIVHRTLEGWNEKTDIQLARTAGDMFPRIVRGIVAGTFNTITIGGINETLNTPLNVFLIENGMIVYSSVLDPNAYPVNSYAVIDYPLGVDYTADEDHIYYIEVSNPDRDLGRFEFRDYTVYQNTTGNYNTAPGIIPVQDGDIVHLTTANALVPTTLQAARIAGTPPPFIQIKYNAGDVKVIRLKAANISYTDPVDLVVTYDGNEVLNTAIAVSSYPTGWSSTVDYLLPDTIHIEDGKLLTVEIKSSTDNHGSLLLEELTLGLPNDLPVITPPEPLPGTIVVKPVVVNSIVLSDVLDNDLTLANDITNFKMDSIINPNATITVTDGTFDTIRLALDNYALSDTITIGVTDTNGPIANFTFSTTDYPINKRTYKDFTLPTTAIADENNSVTVTIGSINNLVGEVIVHELLLDMASNLNGLPPSIDILHDELDLIVESIRQINSTGGVEDTTIVGITTDIPVSPNVEIKVTSGTFDTIRIKAVSKTLNTPMSLKVTYRGDLILDSALLLTDYPIDYLVTKDYVLPNTVNITDPNELLISISSNAVDIGELAFYSIELGINANMGTPAIPVLAFEHSPRCKFNEEWFYGTHLSVSQRTQPLGPCETVTSSLLSDTYEDSIRVTSIVPIEEPVVDANAFSSLEGALPFEYDKLADMEQFKGPIINSVAGNRYILSDDFYNGAAPTCLLEYAVDKYLKEDIVEVEVLEKLLTEYSRFPPIERYYYGPLLVNLYQHIHN